VKIGPTLDAAHRKRAEEPYKLGHPAVHLLLLAGVVIGDGFRDCSANRAATRSADYFP
jgi:hypothetical protein